MRTSGSGSRTLQTGISDHSQQDNSASVVPALEQRRWAPSSFSFRYCSSQLKPIIFSEPGPDRKQKK